MYRLTLKEQPKERDFRSYFVLKPEEQWNDSCVACGLSVYTSPEDVFRLKRRIPAARAKWIAKGTLTATHGLMTNTSSVEKSHHSWWVPVGIEPWTFFIVVYKPDGSGV